MPVITVSAECCFLAGQSLHCSLCIYVLLLLKENGLHPSKPFTLACTWPLGVVMWAPLILLFCLFSTLLIHILPTLNFLVSYLNSTSLFMSPWFFPASQLVWWEDIPSRSREHPHEQRSWLLHRPSQSELSRWLLHLCQVSASHSIFLLLFLFNGVPSLLLTGFLMWCSLLRSLHAASHWQCCCVVNENKLGIWFPNVSASFQVTQWMPHSKAASLGDLLLWKSYSKAEWYMGHLHSAKHVPSICFISLTALVTESKNSTTTH